MSIKLRLTLMNFLQFAVWGAYLTSMGNYLGSIGMSEKIGLFYAMQGIVSHKKGQFFHSYQLTLNSCPSRSNTLPILQTAGSSSALNAVLLTYIYLCFMIFYPIRLLVERPVHNLLFSPLLSFLFLTLPWFSLTSQDLYLVE